MADIKGEIRVSKETRNVRQAETSFLNRNSTVIYRIIAFALLVSIWHVAAGIYKSDLLLPSPWKTARAFLFAIQDVDTLKNLLLTLRRVLTGFGIALLIGSSLGFLMG